MQIDAQYGQEQKDKTSDRWQADCAVKQQMALAKGLALSSNALEIAQRWESWWRFDAARPLIRMGVSKNKALRWNKFEDLDKPSAWVKARRRQIENMELFGEELPWVRIDIGPVAHAAFLGAPLHLAVAEQTSWQDPVIRDWGCSPSFALDLRNEWYRRVQDLTKALAKDAAGSYMFCLPDMSGAVDILANMRGSEQLCLDLCDHRDAVIQAAMQVMAPWEQVYRTLYETSLAGGAAVTSWLGCWSDIPFTVATCDFNALIGREDFTEVCMPSLREQGRIAGRCVFHLDGPSAARHADILASDMNITAIQYVPGMGTPSAVAKIEMLRDIQAAGKPLILSCMSSEVEELCDRLDPRGLALMPWDVGTIERAEMLMSIVTR